MWTKSFTSKIVILFPLKRIDQGKEIIPYELESKFFEYIYWNMNNCYHRFKCELSILNEKHDKLGGKYKLSNLLDFMGDLVYIDAGIGCLLLVITVSALKYY